MVLCVLLVLAGCGMISIVGRIDFPLYRRRDTIEIMFHVLFDEVFVCVSISMWYFVRVVV